MLRTLAFICLLASLSAYVAGAAPFPFAAQGILPWSVWVVLWICINLSVWQKLMRLATFTLLVIWFYAYLGNLIPQSASGPSVTLTDIERTPDAFVEAGKAIYDGKGKCSTCHVIGQGATKPRCPDLENVGFSSEGRKPGMAGKDYFVESLYLPAAYLVEGYGNIMPEIWKPPIALTPLEIETVIAFLQSQGGEPDVSPVIPPVDVAAFEATPQRELKGDPVEGKMIFDEELQCIKCHKVGEQGGEQVAGGDIGIGPELTEIGALNMIEYIEESILEPNSKIVAGFGWAPLRLGNGEELSGTIVNENEGTLTVRVDAAEEEEAFFFFEEEEETKADEPEPEPEPERVVAKEEIAIQPIESRQDLISQGYFWVQAVIHDSIQVSGNIVEEDRISLGIKAGGEMVEVAKDEIMDLSGRQIKVSSKMPKYDEVMTLKQFEDLVTYLASLKGVVAEEEK